MFCGGETIVKIPFWLKIECFTLEAQYRCCLKKQMGIRIWTIKPTRNIYMKPSILFFNSLSIGVEIIFESLVNFAWPNIFTYSTTANFVILYYKKNSITYKFSNTIFFPLFFCMVYMYFIISNITASNIFSHSLFYVLYFDEKENISSVLLFLSSHDSF